MEREAVVFKKPVKVMQVFRMINEYGKDEKSFTHRKDKLVWKEITSSNGYVADGILYLPESIKSDKKFGNCHLITIEDEADITPRHEYKTLNTGYEKGNNHCFNLHHPSRYEIFAFAKDPIELSLRWSYCDIGDPARDNFTIATLENDVPLEVKINGKIDSSRGRYFKEQYYIFHLLGEFRSCSFLTEKDAAVAKSVSAERKPINLIKPLW